MPAWIDVPIFGLTFFIMLVGLLGLMVPIFPGILVIWLAALGYGLVVGFKFWGIVIFLLISLLMFSGVVVDNLLMGAKAWQEGASWNRPASGAGLWGADSISPGTRRRTCRHARHATKAW